MNRLNDRFSNQTAVQAISGLTQCQNVAEVESVSSAASMILKIINDVDANLALALDIKGKLVSSPPRGGESEHGKPEPVGLVGALHERLSELSSRVAQTNVALRCIDVALG
ncbi:MAG: hypothetical protein WDN46_14255 [Methylocella sp.]